MDTWYLKDARGNVVGPLTGAVAVELLRSRPGVFLYTSRDGAPWQAVRAPAIQSLVTTEDPQVRAAREHQEAQRAELELDRLRELAPHNLFGVPKDAALKDYRKGFLSLAKRYHPARLPRDVSPTLLKANMVVYQYLTEVMHELEAKLGESATQEQPQAQVQPNQPPKTAAMPASMRQGAVPTWSLETLNIRKLREQLIGQLHVTRQTAFVFSIHRLMNLKNEAVFFPCLPSLSLGTRLGVTFHFEEAARVVTTRGSVAFESTALTTQPRGFGVRLDLRPEEKGFMLRESQRLMG
jgi:hypothetical protein